MACVEVVVLLDGDLDRLPDALRTSLAAPDRAWTVTLVQLGGDATWERTRRLTASLPGTRAVRGGRAGRGAVLAGLWRDSTADVVACLP
ncbi:hypothetical protein ACFQ3T_27075, partial [Saccharothrix hoggarensis]